MTQDLALRCVRACMFEMRRVASVGVVHNILETATAAELQLAVHYSIVIAVRVEQPDMAIASSNDSSSDEEDLMVLLLAQKRKSRKKRQKRVWVKFIFAQQRQQGDYQLLS